MRVLKTAFLARWVPVFLCTGGLALSGCGQDESSAAPSFEVSPAIEVQPTVALDGVSDLTQLLGHRVLIDEVELRAQAVQLEGERSRTLVDGEPMSFQLNTGDGMSETACAENRWWDLSGAEGETLAFRFGADDEDGFAVRVHGYIARRALDNNTINLVDGNTDNGNMTGSSVVGGGDPDGIPMTVGGTAQRQAGDPDGIPMSQEVGDPDGMPMKAGGDPDGMPMDTDREDSEILGSGDPDGIPMNGDEDRDDGDLDDDGFIDPEEEAGGDPDGMPMNQDDEDDDDDDDDEIGESGDPDGMPMEQEPEEGAEEVGDVDVAPTVDGETTGTEGTTAPGEYGSQMLQDKQRGAEQDLVPFVIVIPESFFVEATLPKVLPEDEVLPLLLRLDARLLLTDSVLAKMRDMYDGEHAVVTMDNDSSMAFGMDTADEDDEVLELTGREPRQED